MERFRRTINLIGEECQQRIIDSKVLILGVGGVGSYAAESIARSGVGRITLMDGDEVAPSNLNRQLVALTSTIGRPKAEVCAERLRDINPYADIDAICSFYKSADDVDVTQYDWVVDAIDDVDAKVELIRTCIDKGVPIVASMGAAGKFGTGFVVADLAETMTCPLAKVMRRRLREFGIEHLPVVYSKEKPQPRRGELGTMSYVPGSAGLVLGGYVIRQLAGLE